MGPLFLRLRRTLERGGSKGKSKVKSQKAKVKSVSSREVSSSHDSSVKYKMYTQVSLAPDALLTFAF